jgi:polyisoprenoid-binding protein YceI
MRAINHLAFMALAIISIAAGPAPGKYTVASGKVTFLATGKPGFLRINGKNGSPQGSFVIDGKKNLVNGEVTVKLETLETGISLRDRHMKEKYLETSKYPEAKFIADPLSLVNASAKTKVSLPGTLTIHGKPHPVTADAVIHVEGEKIEVQSIIETRLSEFDIAIPAYAGITVADKVVIETSFTATLSPFQGSKP